METTQNCHSLRDSILTFLDRQTEVTAFNDYCLITLPIKTVDDRYLDVYVEPKIGDFYLVHDGGKTSAELYAQGLHLTASRMGLLQALAERFGATFDSGTFTIGCRSESVQQAVFSISQCASLAMLDVLNHHPVIEEEPLIAQVRRTLDKWKPESVELRYRLAVKGNTQNSQHVFDFVAFPNRSGRKTVAVKVLSPTYGSMIQARNYGFLALDLKQTIAGGWPRLAVISKSEQWGDAALNLVRQHSDATIAIPANDSKQIPAELPAMMDRLAA